MMELEHMSDSMMRPRPWFDMRRDVFALPKYAKDEKRPEHDDDFFVDLPVMPHKYKPIPFQLWQDENVPMNTKPKDNASSDTDASTDMEVDDQGSEKVDPAEDATMSVKTTKKAKGDADANNKFRNKNKQLRPRSVSKTTSSSKRDVAEKTDAGCHTFSSYSFSNSSVVDDKGRRVTTTRRRYEDSSGRLKAVHEREIDGKKLRTTWLRQSKDDEGQHEAICSSGSPEEFEALWQQTPFGEAQKKSVKGQLQSKSDVEKEVAPVLEGVVENEMQATKTSVKNGEKASTE